MHLHTFEAYKYFYDDFDVHGSFLTHIVFCFKAAVQTQIKYFLAICCYFGILLPWKEKKCPFLIIFSAKKDFLRLRW